MSIEGIALEHFNALPQTEIKSSTKSCPRHSVFPYCLLDDSKQDSATTTSYIKFLTEMLNIYIYIDVSIKYNMGEYWWLCRTI